MSDKYPGGIISLGGPVSSSVSFNGSSQYLTAPSSSAFAFGTGDFTIEAWVYITADSSAVRAFWQNGASDSCNLQRNTSGNLQAWDGADRISTTPVPSNVWSHVAFTRTSGTARIFVNGVQALSWTSSVNYSANSTWVIGYTASGTNLMTGYISNFRIAKGTSLYTGSFTPPQSTLTAITNTQLLTCQSPTIVDNSSNAFTITNNGAATVSTLTPFQAYSPSLLSPALGAATPGVWTLDQAMYAAKNRSWPMYDPYYNAVVLNLHGNGTNGAQNNTFLDSSGNNYAITRNGTATQGTYSPYGNTWSAYFNGSSQNIAIPSTAQVTLGTNSFTFEGWVFVSGAVGTYGVFVQSSSSAYFPQATTNSVALGTSSSNWQIYCNNTSYVSTSTWAPGNWYHYAVVRSGTTTQLYINGTSVITVTGDATNYTGTYLGYGNIYGTTYYLNGYLSNCRLVNGTAVYTSNFTPPTTPLTAITNTALLICQSNRFVDNSVNNFTITPSGAVTIQRFNPFYYSQGYSPAIIGGSAYFNGSNDYLVAPGNGTNFSTSNFTIEGWVNVNSVALSSMRLIQYQNQNAANSNYAWYVLINTGTIQAYVVNGSTISGPAGNLIGQNITVNTWHHFAVVRNGTSLQVFVDGIGGTAITIPASINNPTGANYYIGSDYTSIINYSGYIADLRVTNNVAVYNGNFTPPTAPLGISQSANANASPSNALTSPVVNGYQVAFNGSSQYLTTPSSTAWQFGTGNFTIECWVYPTSFGAGNIYISNWVSASPTYTTGQWELQTDNSSGRLAFYWATSSSSVASVNSGTTYLVTNTWSHVAVVRNGTTISLYINGVSVGTATSSATIGAAGTNAIGYQQVNTPQYFAGNLSNVRIVNNSAVYTSNFVPSSSPLTAITGTSLLTCQNSTIIDNSTNAAVITNNGSATTAMAVGPFSGTYANALSGSNYLSIADNANIEFGSGSITLECWFNLSGSNGYLLDKNNSAGTPVPGFSLYVSTTTITWYYDAANNGYIISPISVTINQNQWYHLALVRSVSGSTTNSVYLNGVRVGSSTTATAFPDNTQPFRIGCTNLAGSPYGYFTGSISNLRFVKGTAVYDPTQTSFFPPQGPLTAITNTQLLTCQNNTIVDNSSNAFTITNNSSVTVNTANGLFGNTTTPQLLLNNTNAGVLDNSMINDLYTVGSAQINTSIVKYGTGSISFNGSTDYLQALDSPNLRLTGNFTIEFWMYPTSTASGAIITKWTSGNVGYYIGFATTNSLAFYSTSISTGLSATFSTTNTWTHVAVTRNGNTYTLWINGNSANTTTSATTNSDGGQVLVIGKNSGNNINYYSGYLDDIRITNGYARYSANFTPPTSQLQDF